MILNKLKLTNFRNYRNLLVDFKPGIHFFYGKNAQGKTNLLEAIYYLSTTKSFQTNVDNNLIANEQEYFMIEANVGYQSHQTRLKLVKTLKGKKVFKNNHNLKKLSDFLGILNAVIFSPADLAIFSGAPRNRRKFLDVEIAKVSKRYLALINDYEQLIKERNAYLKKGLNDEFYLASLDEKLAPLNIQIYKQRTAFLKTIQQIANPFYQEVALDNTMINLGYESSLNSTDLSEAAVLELFKKARNKDFYTKSTNIGIHKDDLKFYINDQLVSEFSSQGQKRTYLLAIKFALVKWIAEYTNEYPILLLDDVFSELDSFRRSALLEKLEGKVQIFITTTDKVVLKNNHNIYYHYVNNGVIEMYLEEE